MTTPPAPARARPSHVASSPSARRLLRHLRCLAPGALLLPALVPAATVTWDGGAGSALWSDTANWSTDALPASTDSVQFTGTSSFGLLLNGNRSVSSVTFSGTSGYTLVGNTLTLSDGTTGIFTSAPSSGTVTHSIYSNVSMTASSAPISTASNATLLLGGSLTTAGLLAIQNSGTVILEGTATPGTSTQISNGTLQVGNGGTTGSLSGNVAITASAATLKFNRSNALTYSGVISGSVGGVTKTGAGKLTLTGVNTHTGTLTISGGSVDLGGGTSAGTWAGPIANSGTLTFNHTAAQTYSNVISGTGSLYKSGSNTLTLSGVSTFTGTSHLETGTVVLGNSAALGTGQITFNGGALQYGTGISTDISSRTVQIDSGGGTLHVGNTDVVFANGIGNSGSGALTKTGGYTLTINGASTYTGGTVLDAGWIGIGNAAALGTTGTISFAGGGLKWNGNTTDLSSRFSTAEGQAYNFEIASGGVGFHTALSSTGATLDKTGSGTLTLYAAQTFSGSMTGSQGTLALGSSSDVTLTGTLNIGGGLTTKFSPATSHSITNTITGSGTLKVENQTLTFDNDASTFSGTLGFSAATGSIIVGNGGSGALFDAKVQLANSTNSVTFNSNSDFTHTNVISGSGTFNKNGTGTLTNSAVNTLSGPLNVNAGTLVLSGDNTLTSAVTIASGATLQLGNGGTTGSIDDAASVTNNGTIAFNRSDDLIFSSSSPLLSGTGGVTIGGTGQIVYDTDATYTGPTTISTNGSLQIGGTDTKGSISSSSAIVVNGAMR